MYIPVVNDRLMISFKRCHILFLINFSTSVGMLFGPDDLLLSKESIINKISRLLADSNRKQFSFNFTLQFLSYIREVVIETISYFIRIVRDSPSISVDVGWPLLKLRILITFLIPLHVFLICLQFSVKYF